MRIIKTTLLTIALSLGLGGVALAGGGEKAHKSKDLGAMIQDWPDASQTAAKEMMRKYGQPDEVTRNRLIWHDNGIWERTTVNREPTRHLFPKPHDDVLEQVVHFEIDPEFVDELVAYDGSVYVDRTRGELSARCDQEAANLIALNLAEEIARGDKSVDEARRDYARHVMAMMRGEPTRYAQTLMFDPDPARAADPDRTVISQSFLSQYEMGLERERLGDVEDRGLRDVSRERRTDALRDAAQQRERMEDADGRLRDAAEERERTRDPDERLDPDERRDLDDQRDMDDRLDMDDRRDLDEPRDFDDQWDEVEPGQYERIDN